jgi:hypothetical protein
MGKYNDQYELQMHYALLESIGDSEVLNSEVQGPDQLAGARVKHLVGKPLAI